MKTTIRENMQQYILLLESNLTPAPLRNQIHATLLNMADIVDLVMNDPAFNKSNEVKQEETPKKKSKKK
tara:strand:+ start:927 stop:1133 length:207 start_codon:yes stop_codon:yes gene_type:complete